MNAFVLHHRDSIAFSYHCFDRIVCNAHIPALQWEGNAAAFLRHQRQVPALTPAFFRDLSGQYHRWLQAQLQEASLPLIEPPRDIRREDWVEPYYRALGDRPGVAVILKCREPARVVVSSARHAQHIEFAWRYVNLYYFYLQDAALGRMWLRLCPYFPFNGRVCLNGHNWLANQLRQEGIGFRQDHNGFLACDDPARLQTLADAFSAQHIEAAVNPWLEQWLPYFTFAERQRGYQHRLFATQVEYCDNLIFHSKAVLDRLFARLLDNNRAFGNPAKLAVIFGRKNFRPDTRTGQVEVKVTVLRTPVLRTNYDDTALKQYVRGGLGLRTESCTHQLRDLSIPKRLPDALPRLREVLGQSNERFLDAEQDILESYLDRGQLQALRRPTVSAAGRRTPGLRLDDPRLLAVLQALTSFVYLIGNACFRTADLLPDVQRLLGEPNYTLSRLRYDLAKLRGKSLVLRLPGTQRYRLPPEGYRLAVLYLKLYHRLYAPLTSGTLDPQPCDNRLPTSRLAKLDRLYQAVDKALHVLSKSVGVAA